MTHFCLSASAPDSWPPRSIEMINLWKKSVTAEFSLALISKAQSERSESTALDIPDFHEIGFHILGQTAALFRRDAPFHMEVHFVSHQNDWNT